MSNFQAYFLSRDEVVLTKEYQLIVHDANTLQKIFLEFQKLSISNVSIQKVDNTKMEQYRKEVKDNAIKAAKSKAESLAKSIDQTIGRALYVQEQDFDKQPVSEMLQGRMAGVMLKSVNSYNDISQGPDTGMEFEKIKLNSSILVRFELK
jgi:uncharacterized protein